MYCSSTSYEHNGFLRLFPFRWTLWFIDVDVLDAVEASIRFILFQSGPAGHQTEALFDNEVTILGSERGIPSRLRNSVAMTLYSW